MDDKEPAIRVRKPSSPEASLVAGDPTSRLEAARPSGSVAHRRRAERRQATYDEMMSRARRAVEEGRPLSLRAIAAEMGLTAPALYRYVDSHAALQAALAEAVFDDVVLILEEAASREGDDGAALVAAMVAFRQWAVDRPHEFRLLCSMHEDSATAVDTSGGEPSWALRLAVRFMPRVERLYRAGRITPPTLETLPSGATEAIEGALPRWFPDGDVPDLPVGLWWAGVRHWALLCGTVGVEVHGLVGQPFREGALLREALRATCVHLGLAENDPTLRRVVDERLRGRRTA